MNVNKMPTGKKFFDEMNEDGMSADKMSLNEIY
jgi:hypothetical protein